MMMTEAPPKIRVLCVDDNPLVTQALQVQLAAEPDMQVIATVSTADELLARVARGCPDVVLLDYDMPGKPAFQAISELASLCKKARVLMYSGYVEPELIDRALDAGAWGYVAKIDRQEDLIAAIRDVASGSFGFSPTVRGLHGGA